MIPTRFNRLGIPCPYGRRLTYLESTGTQCIDTGVLPDFAGGDRITASYFKADMASNNALLGCRPNTLINGFYALKSGIILCGDSTYSVVSSAAIGDVELEIDDSAVVINGGSSAMPQRVTCAFSVYLFAFNVSGVAALYYSGMRLYDWKYYRNGALAQHLVPVLDKIGVPCLFDEVTRTFKYNAGTGTFNYA